MKASVDNGNPMPSVQLKLTLIIIKSKAAAAITVNTLRQVLGDNNFNISFNNEESRIHKKTTSDQQKFIKTLLIILLMPGKTRK